MVRLREKSIKRKISYYDLFRKVEKAGSGFITRESWLGGIGEVLTMGEDEKESLFSFMDAGEKQVVDYKTFLAIMNSNQAPTQGEKFDWAEQVVERIKKWYGESRLTLVDAFRVIDRDGDSYLSEKDLHGFLVEKLGFKERELSSVRLQKL